MSLRNNSDVLYEDNFFCYLKTLNSRCGVVSIVDGDASETRRQITVIKRCDVTKSASYENRLNHETRNYPSECRRDADIR